MRLHIAVALLFLSSVSFGQTRSRQTVLLYPEGQEGHADVVNGISGFEEQRPYGFLSNISDSARFEIFLPEQNSGIMVVLCPGGGYGEISAYIEGSCAAEWFNRHGVAAAVLIYRLPNGHDTVPLEDVHRTILYCRDHAAEMGIHTLGIFGGSAGGHLAASASTLFTDAQTRPDFTILFYPVITMEEALTDAGTRRRLIGENPADVMVEKYSPQLQVSSDTPPCYVIVSEDDPIVPPENSRMYVSALEACGVPAELHVLPDGGHGWGFSKGYPELEKSLAPWVLSRGVPPGPPSMK